MIRAECHTDDFAVATKFDATPWFAEASKDEIMALCQQGWGGDYGADAVAHHFEDTPGYNGIGEIFNYLAKRPRGASGDAIGFEVHVHAPDAMRWLHENRIDVFAACAEEMVLDENEKAALTAGNTKDPSWDSDKSWPDRYEAVETAVDQPAMR